MPIIEIYQCKKNIEKQDFEELSRTISNILSIDSSLVWFMQHNAINTNSYKGHLYNQEAPIVFFNARQKYDSNLIIQSLKRISEKIAEISGCKVEQIFCGTRRLLDDEIIQPLP